MEVDSRRMWYNPSMNAKRCLNAVLLGCLLLFVGCALFSPSSKRDQDYKPKTESTAGRDSTVWNVSLQTVADNAGWGGTIMGLILTVQATIKARRRDHIASTVVHATDDCPDCKAAVNAKHDKAVNEYVEYVIHQRGKKPHRKKHTCKS